LIIVGLKIPYNSPSLGGREIEGGEFTLTLILSLQGRGVLEEVSWKTIGYVKNK